MNDPAIIFLATTYEPHCAVRIDKHLDGYSTMQFMSSGGVALAYDGQASLLEGAWFWPAYPGPRTQFHPAPGYETWFHRHVGFQGPLLQQWAAAGLWPEGPQPAPPGRDWAAFFDTLIAQAKRTDRWGRLRAANLLEQLLLELAEARAQPVRGELGWLDKVLDALASAARTQSDYTALAQKLGMGSSTLRRHFKAATGLSLHQYVLQSRMASARTLLGETDLPIKAVAERLGYDNVYFFSRQFHQYLHVTPGAYRKSRQK
jgi:AraC-like DNA-binding protein